MSRCNNRPKVCTNRCWFPKTSLNGGKATHLSARRAWCVGASMNSLPTCSRLSMKSLSPAFHAGSDTSTGAAAAVVECASHTSLYYATDPLGSQNTKEFSPGAVFTHCKREGRGVKLRNYEFNYVIESRQVSASLKRP